MNFLKKLVMKWKKKKDNSIIRENRDKEFSSGPVLDTYIHYWGKSPKGVYITLIDVCWMWVGESVLFIMNLFSFLVVTKP
jgi:hypothetical protein